MYRCVTLECVRRKISCTDLDKIEKVLDEIKNLYPDYNFDAILDADISD